MEWYLNDGLNNRLQWGSEIWTCLDFELSKRGWVEEGPNFKCMYVCMYLDLVSVTTFLK